MKITDFNDKKNMMSHKLFLNHKKTFIQWKMFNSVFWVSTNGLYTQKVAVIRYSHSNTLISHSFVKNKSKIIQQY